MSGTAQQLIHAIALSTLEMIASQPAIVFQTANDRLNRLAVLQTITDSGCNPALLPRDVNRIVHLIMAAIAIDPNT